MPSDVNSSDTLPPEFLTARKWSCAKVTCGHPGQAVLSAVLIMGRQEVSPESDVECELCDKIQV